jgi:uncharacterized protein with PhoU and TrkA domain
MDRDPSREQSIQDAGHVAMIGDATDEQDLLEGQTLSTLSQAHPGVLVVGLRRDNRLHCWHDIDGAIASGDVLVALGTPVSLGEFAGQA